MDEIILNSVLSRAHDYPKLATFFMAIGLLRLAVKPTLEIIRALVKSTPGDEDDKALDAVEHSNAWRAFCWALNLLASVKIGPQR